MQSLCVVGDRIYAHSTGTGAEGVISVFRRRPEGSLTRVDAFGKIYDPSSADAVWRVRRGEFACSRSGDRVLVISNLIGDVRSFDSNGNLLWYSIIDGFEPIEATLKPDGGIRMEIPSDGFTVPRSLTSTPDGGVLLQLAGVTRASKAAERPYAYLHTYYLSARGEGTIIPGERGIIHHSGRQLVLESRELPFPRLFVLKANER